MRSVVIHTLKSFVLILLCYALMGCGGSGGQSSQQPNSFMPPANNKPVVAAENADVKATVGLEFNYDAAQGGLTFSDRDNDTLSYSVRFNSEDTRGLLAEGGTIIGTPISVGSVNLTIIATDPDGETAADNFSIRVGSKPELVSENEDQFTRIGTVFSYDASQDGKAFEDLDRDALDYVVTFSPSGQGLTAEGALISGTASSAGIVTVTILATDDDGLEAQDSFDITVLPREDSQIFITQENEKINIFVKGSVETSNKYLRYQLSRFNNPNSRSQGWGWRLLHEASLQADDTFELGLKIMRGGENFVAIREVGKSDFMGGANHGDHIDSAFTLLVDGEEKEIDGASHYIGTDIEFQQVSTLYEVDVVESIETAIVNTNFRMAYGINTLNNRVEFSRPTELSTAQLTMLSADRHFEGDVNSTLITGTAKWSPDFTPYDVSMPFHNAPALKADTIQLSGPNGFQFEVKMTSGWEGDNRRSIVNSGPEYNKLYFSPIGNYPSVGPGLSVPAGHVIEVEAEYRLDTTN